MRKRTSKWIANRTDVTYPRRGSAVKRWRLGTTLISSALALGWIEVSFFRKSQTMYNPGPVAPVHAMIEEKCTACHDGKGGGSGFFSHDGTGFFRTVSDNACLKCHDGAIHNANQMSLISSDPQHPQVHPHSTQCTTCHVEHHGQEALAGTSDALCVRCHGDLAKHSKKEEPGSVNGGDKSNEIRLSEWAPRIKAFDDGTHPKFGRRLMEQGQLFDRTRLRFNHKKHTDPNIESSYVKPLEGQKENCTVCHRTNDPRMVPGSNAVTVTLEPDPDKIVSVIKKGSDEQLAATQPALAGPRVESVGISDGLYMQPVSFERDCARCHYIRLPDSQQTRLPHESLEAIHPMLSDLAGLYRPVFAKLFQSYSPQKKEAELLDNGAPPAPKNAGSPFPKPSAPEPGHSGPRSAFPKPAEPPASPSGPPSAFRKPTTKAEKKFITEEQWIDKKVNSELGDLKKKLEKWAAKAANHPSQEGLSELIASLAGKDDSTAQWTVLEDALALNGELSSSRCVKCHDVAGSPLALYEQQMKTASAAATRPASMPEPLHTLPTGIPASSRRWFSESRFSHRGHQNIYCTSCHVAATTSENTSDVLSPNLTWQEAGKAVGCADCHHAPNSIDRGAGSNCVTCHIFHDRGKEGLPQKIETIDAILHPSTMKLDSMAAAPKPEVPAH